MLNKWKYWAVVTNTNLRQQSICENQWLKKDSGKTSNGQKDGVGLAFGDIQFRGAKPWVVDF
jgi:hypothetical protein